MIARLTGTVVFVGGAYFILEVGGVGYKIYATLETIRRVSREKDITIHTHQVVREDALDLYGFLDPAEVSFFELLITIPGIGPKTALSVLNVAPVETLRRAASHQDSSYLTKVSGIGKKTADKIMLELKDKFGSIEATSETATQEEVEALEGLQALGYSLKEAREALKDIEGGTAEERIKKALQKLS